MENDEFDEDDDVLEDVDQVDYMLSDEWNSDIDLKSSINYFAEFFLKTKNLDAAFANLIISDFKNENVQKLESILSKPIK
jgi:hypothetical protein